MEISFNDKVVLVTGASSGIGKAIALLFAKCQARLALVGRNEENLKAVGKQCEDLSKEPPLLVLADLATDEGCEAVAKQTIDHFGRLDVLINNAGISARATIQTTDMETFDRVFNVDIRGVYNLTRLLVKELIKTKGNIINISSVASIKVSVGYLPYSMAKAALNHFTRLVAKELAPKGVRVNAVLPGITDISVGPEMKPSDEEYKNWLDYAKTKIPMGEVCIGDDIASTVVHLASQQSRLVTGTLVAVDGGSLL